MVGCVLLVAWFAWLVYLVVGGLVGVFAGWRVGGLLCLLVGWRVVGWSVGLIGLVGWLVVVFAGWLAFWLTG